MNVEELVKRCEAKFNRTVGKGAPDKYLGDNVLRFIGDAYVCVSTLLRKPITSNSSTTTVVDTASYSIPADCLGNFSGIISVEYDGKPLFKTDLHTMQERYNEDWKEPEDLEEVKYFLEYDDEESIFLVLPADDTVTLKFTYVQKPTQPTDYSDTIPRFIEPYVPYIPDFVVGQALSNDKAGRGAAMVASFENRILQQVRRDKRNRTVRPGRESYTLGIQNYHDSYGNRNRRRYR